MDLTTRCPRCSTVFQVGLQDLQLRKGYIRCVQCAHIFDGYAEVVSESNSASAPRDVVHEEILQAVPDLPPHAAPFTVPHVFRSSRGGTEPQFTVGSPGGAHGPDEQSEEGPRGLDSIPSIIVEPHPARASSQGGSAAPLLRPDGIGLLEQLGRWLVGTLVLLSIVVLLGQIVYVYRAQIALTFPALRPALVRACEPLNCQVPYARSLAQLAITGSDLKLDASAHEMGATPRHFVLHISLRNRAVQPQEWPSIVLDLNDASGVRLVRRNLSPREYLTPALLAGPFAPDSEVQVQVPITLNDIQINGYQLDLFFS